MDAAALADLNARVAGCTACGLAAGRTHTVPGEGDPNTEILFIGEAPGRNEDLQGRPFVGQAGRMLDRLLGEIELTREQVFIANILKCRPPQNRDPLPDEIAACQPFLAEQIAGIRPKLIVPLGRFAMNHFLPDSAISRTHGRPVRVGTQLVYPTYHPAAALRQGALLRTLQEDFARIPALVAQAERPPVAAPIPEQSLQEQDSGVTQLQLL